MQTLQEQFKELESPLQFGLQSCFQVPELRLFLHLRREEIQTTKLRMDPHRKDFHRTYVKLHHEEEFLTKFIELIDENLKKINEGEG